VRFPISASIADVPPRFARAVVTALRQVPPLTSYALHRSVEKAGVLREQVQQRLGGEHVARDEPSPEPIPEPIPEQDALPIADWDRASVPSLRARVARLTLDELLQLRAYETEHAARLAVLTMLDNRIAKVDQTGGFG